MRDRFTVPNDVLAVGVTGDGRPYIRVPPTGAAVTPPPLVTVDYPITAGGVTTIEQRVAGGAQLDPVVNSSQGYDPRAAQFDGSLTLAGPTTMFPGQAIISTTPENGVDKVDAKSGFYAEIATLYAVAESPGRNSVAPAAVDWVNRGTPVWRTADFHDLASTLPEIDTTAITSGSIVSQAECMAMLSRENPIYPQQYGPDGMQNSAPRNWTGVGVENYGGTVADKWADRLKRLLSTEPTVDEKTDILRAFARLGIDWGDPLDGHFSQIAGEVLGGNGHVASPGPVPIAIARWAFGESRDFSQAGGNWLQYFKMTAPLLAELGPHYSDNATSAVADGVKPGFARIRPAPLVSGDEIDVDVSPAFMPNGGFAVGDGQFHLVNVATGEKALVTGARNQKGTLTSLALLSRGDPGDTQTVVLETGGGAKFSNGAEVYFEPTAMPVVGAYEFCIQAAFRSLLGGGWQNYTPGWNQPYQRKRWNGVHLTAINMIWGGTWPTVWEPLIGYFLRTRADARYPTESGSDFDRDFIAAALAHTPLVIPT